MTVVIAAGGTGGHVYPGIALAREFLRIDPQTPVLFVGTARGLEAKVVPHEGFELATIDAKPVMGGGPLKALRGLLALPAGIRQSVRLLKARQAGLVIGIGGYASPPVVLAAWLLGIPRVLVEPNAYPGVANRALGPLAQRVFLAFESAGARFSRAKVRVVGTPVRRSLMEGTGRRADSAAGRQVLVFGGSQGARAINEAMMAAAPFLKAKEPALVVRHQTGEADHTRVARAYREAGVQAEVVPYLYDMTEALGVADLVVCRAGATTVAELTASGKPAILIPLPHAIHRHQDHNARVLEAAGAALVLRQEELTGANLAEAIVGVLGNPARIQRMRERSLALRRTDSAEHIVGECRALVEQRV